MSRFGTIKGFIVQNGFLKMWMLNSLAVDCLKFQATLVPFDKKAVNTRRLNLNKDRKAH